MNPKLAAMAALALANEATKTPDATGDGFEEKRVRPRTYTAQDRRAFEKRVAKRRAKKGYK